jgi:hypothetical protein
MIEKMTSKVSDPKERIQVVTTSARMLSVHGSSPFRRVHATLSQVVISEAAWGVGA